MHVDVKIFRENFRRFVMRFETRHVARADATRCKGFSFTLQSLFPHVGKADASRGIFRCDAMGLQSPHYERVDEIKKKPVPNAGRAMTRPFGRCKDSSREIGL
jgi:hypothetical protein